VSSTNPIKEKPTEQESLPVVSPGEAPQEADEERAQAGTTNAAAKPTRKPLGVKEVPPFAWKLLGSSAGAVVTLFKSAVREEVEAQQDRVLRDGYYSDLKVVDIDFKVVQPRTPKKKKTAAARAKKAKTSAKPAPKPKTTKQKTTAERKVKKKKTATKKATSSAKRTTSKRSSSAKSSAAASKKKATATKSKTKRTPKAKKKR